MDLAPVVTVSHRVIAGCLMLPLRRYPEVIVVGKLQALVTSGGLLTTTSTVISSRVTWGKIAPIDRNILSGTWTPMDGQQDHKLFLSSTWLSADPRMADGICIADSGHHDHLIKWSSSPLGVMIRAAAPAMNNKWSVINEFCEWRGRPLLLFFIVILSAYAMQYNRFK